MREYKLFYYGGHGQLVLCNETLAETYNNPKDAFNKMIGLVGSYPMYNQICLIEFVYNKEGKEIESKILDWAEISDDDDDDNEIYENLEYLKR